MQSDYKLMNLTLEPGKYTYLSWHINKAKALPMTIDVRFKATGNSNVIITGMGCENPMRSENDDWDYTCMQAYANYTNWNINGPMGKNCQSNFKGLNIKKPLSANQEFWFMNIYEEIDAIYPSVTGQQGVFTIIDFEVTGDPINFVELAYFDRSSINPAAYEVQNAPYRWDGMTKGISDVSTTVDCDMYYTIDESMGNEVNANGYKILPVRVFNSYEPMGFASDTWVSHLNPQSDGGPRPDYPILNSSNPNIGNRQITAESDIVRVKYYDTLKPGLYGSNVSQQNKKDEWYFDPYHTALTTPIEKLASQSYSKLPLSEHPDFKPNEPLNILSPWANDSELTTFDTSPSIGNYGINDKYNFKVTNNTDADKYINYHLFSESNNVVICKNNAAGDQVITTSGERGAAYHPTSSDKDRAVVSFRIPAHQTADISLTVILTTGHSGGMQNYLKLTNTSECDISNTIN